MARRCTGTRRTNYSDSNQVYQLGAFRLLSFWRNSPTRARAASCSTFVDHTLHTTVGRTPLDEGSARPSTWHHTTLTRNKHPCPQRDSNPQSQQASGRRPRLSPLGHWDRLLTTIQTAYLQNAVNSAVNTRPDGDNTKLRENAKIFLLTFLSVSGLFLLRDTN